MPGNYCSISDVKSYLTMTTTDNDGLLGALIPRVCRWWDRAATSMPQGWDRETVNETVSPIVDKDGNLSFLTGKPTVSAITSLLISTAPGQPSVTADLSKIWLPAERVTLMDGRWLSSRGCSLRATISYTGGYSPVPEDVVHACIVMTARIFKQKDAGFSDVVGSADSGVFQYSKLMTKEVKTIVDDRRRVAHR